MEEIGLEEWKKIKKMGALTRGYLATPSIEASVEKCAKTLSDPASIESTLITEYIGLIVTEVGQRAAVDGCSK
jgi:hypothetical protein